MTTRVVSFAGRPELDERWEGLVRPAWPEFMFHDPACNRFWGRHYDDFPEFQFSLVDAERDEILCWGNTVPFAWDGSSEGLLGAMADLAAGAGFGDLVAPVRPSRKHEYPLIPIDRYVRWTREDGLPFDEWIRVHVRLGAEIVRTAHASMRIPGSVADWEAWSGMSFPETGTYVVPGALVPVRIDRERDEGVYVEPNVWMRHRVDAR